MINPIKSIRIWIAKTLISVHDKKGDANDFGYYRTRLKLMIDIITLEDVLKGLSKIEPGVEIQTPFSNSQEMYYKLKVANESFLRNERLADNSIFSNKRKVSLLEFFTTNKGVYVNPKPMVVELLATLRNIIEVELPDGEAKNFNEYNLHFLYKVLNDFLNDLLENFVFV